MIAHPSAEFSRRAAELRAFTARALRAMADKVQPVTAERVVVRFHANGMHRYFVTHTPKSRRP